VVLPAHCMGGELGVGSPESLAFLLGRPPSGQGRKSAEAGIRDSGGEGECHVRSRSSQAPVWAFVSYDLE
jgi:hypothetical protein